MADTVETISIDEDSEIARILDRATNEPVLLKKRGVLYRLSVVHDDWSESDPERIEQMLNEVAGSWVDEDGDAMIADIYEARERGSRPADRPRPFTLP